MGPMNSKPPGKSFLRVGEVAKAAGVSTDTLRHYERKGVLPKANRSHNGYRQYPEETLDRLRMIRQALLVGFTLDELSSVFKIRDRGGAPCQEVRNLAARKLANLEVQLHEMVALRNQLRDSLRDWDARLSKTPTGERADLLRGLTNRNLASNSSSALALQRHKFKKRNEG